MSKVLVTGATGFIGGHLTSALVEAGHEVTCLVRPTSKRDKLAALGVRFVEGDINDLASVARAVATAEAEVVYHLAAMLKQPWHPQFLTTNADGVRLVARACADAGGPVLLSVSSIAAVGPAPDGRPLVESDPPQPVSRYGQSKLGGEEAARELADRLPITIVRPPAVVGEGDTAALPLFEMAARGFHLVPGAGEDRLSMIHVSDLVTAIMAAAERGERLGDPADGLGKGIYFAAADERPTVRELAELLAPAVGRDSVRVLSAPRVLAKLVGAAAEGVARLRKRASFVNYDKMLEANAGSWTCSTDKARDQLGWAPAARLADRLLQTGAWYRDEGWI